MLSLSILNYSREANERLVRVLRDSRLESIQSQHIEVGDVVHLEDSEEVPADLVLLSSSHDQGETILEIKLGKGRMKFECNKINGANLFKNGQRHQRRGLFDLPCFGELMLLT